MDSDIAFSHLLKDKVVFVLGATATGKSRLSVDLALRFNGEIINSDKMQVYKGLDIVTNKITEDEQSGIPHHLLATVDPEEDFSAVDFTRHALLTIDSILKRGRLPIIAGGSNSFVKALVNDDPEFLSKYECCFLWVQVSEPVLNERVSDRVDQMVEAGLPEEVRGMFDPNADYTRGIRRSIGVPELDEYFRVKKNNPNLLEEGIEKIKNNTCKLANRQVQNICKLQDDLGWNIHKLDATETFIKTDSLCVNLDAWDCSVLEPSTMIVGQFLSDTPMAFTTTPATQLFMPTIPKIKMGAVSVPVGTSTMV